MVKDRLVDKLRKGFYTGLTAGSLAVGAIYGCTEDNPVEPPINTPLNTPPEVTISMLSPTFGRAPLPVEILYTCKDDKGVKQYTLISGIDTLVTKNPIDTTIVYNERTNVTRECEDEEGKKAVEGPTSIEVQPNNPPQTSLDVSPTSGVSPLEVGVQYSCIDPDGADDIEQSRLIVGNDTLTTTSIDSTFTFAEPGIYTMSGYCRDKAGEESTSGPVDTEVTPQPILSQTVSLSNFIDINYSVTFTNAAKAKREIFHDGNLISTDTISVSPYTQTLVERLSGNWRFIGIPIAPNAKPDTVSLDVPDYDSEAPDLSGLNLDMNEGDSLVVHLPRATDKNPEDNPVHYTNITSPDGRVEPSIGAFPNDTVLKIKAIGAPGQSQIELEREGSLEKIVLPLEIFDLPHISGQLQNAITDTGARGFIRVYNAADSTFLRDYITDIQGNFDFQLDEPIDNILLQAEISVEVLAGLRPSYVRTITLSGKDTTGLLIRPFPYSQVLVDNGIKKEDLRSYFDDTNPSFWKPHPTFLNIEIVGENPLGRGTFTPNVQDEIEGLIKDNLSCYVEGREFNIQKDDTNSEIHYRENNLGLLPDSNWVVIQRDTTGTARGTGYPNREGFIDRGIVLLGSPSVNPNVTLEYLISHEMGHVYLAPVGHVRNPGPIPPSTTVMDPGLVIKIPGITDCEVARILNETTYAPLEDIGNILGLDFLPKKTILTSNNSQRF